VRQSLFKAAHERFDFDAGNELFSTWKELRGVRAARATEKQAADAAAAQATARACRASECNFCACDCWLSWLITTTVFQRREIEPQYQTVAQFRMANF
jgi:hypothetical protein